MQNKVAQMRFPLANKINTLMGFRLIKCKKSVKTNEGDRSFTSTAHFTDIRQGY